VQALLLVESKQVAAHQPRTRHHVTANCQPPPQRAKEAYVIPTLPWLRATYLHRSQQQRFLHEVALAALHAAASAGSEGLGAMAEADAAVRVTADAAALQHNDGHASA